MKIKNYDFGHEMLQLGFTTWSSVWGIFCLAYMPYAELGTCVTSVWCSHLTFTPRLDSLLLWQTGSGLDVRVLQLGLLTWLSMWIPHFVCMPYVEADECTIWLSFFSIPTSNPGLLSFWHTGKVFDVKMFLPDLHTWLSLRTIIVSQFWGFSIILYIKISCSWMAFLGSMP